MIVLYRSTPAVSQLKINCNVQTTFKTNYLAELPFLVIIELWNSIRARMAHAGALEGDWRPLKLTLPQSAPKFLNFSAYRRHVHDLFFSQFEGRGPLKVFRYAHCRCFGSASRPPKISILVLPMDERYGKGFEDN